MNGVSYQKGARPHIQMDHIDGPLLHKRNGTLHWLTLWERYLVWVGWEDEYSLERKHWRTP